MTTADDLMSFLRGKKSSVKTKSIKEEGEN